MNVEQLAIPKRKAEEEYETLKQVFKQHNTFRSQDQIYRDMQKVYGHLQHGKKIIDIYDAFKKVGLNEETDPKLAIVRADGKTCWAWKSMEGSIRFSINRLERWHRTRKNDGDITLPQETFKWSSLDVTKPFGDWNIKHQQIKTIVPIIPPQILIDEVKYLLPNYYILWEVEKWQPIPPRDPILLKQLTPNLFGVLATWNLTELERAIIRGRIQ